MQEKTKKHENTGREDLTKEDELFLDLSMHSVCSLVRPNNAGLFAESNSVRP